VGARYQKWIEIFGFVKLDGLEELSPNGCPTEQWIQSRWRKRSKESDIVVDNCLYPYFCCFTDAYEDMSIDSTEETDQTQYFVVGQDGTTRETNNESEATCKASISAHVLVITRWWVGTCFWDDECDACIEV